MLTYAIRVSPMVKFSSFKTDVYTWDPLKNFKLKVSIMDVLRAHVINSLIEIMYWKLC